METAETCKPVSMPPIHLQIESLMATLSHTENLVTELCQRTSSISIEENNSPLCEEEKESNSPVTQSLKSCVRRCDAVNERIKDLLSRLEI